MDTIRRFFKRPPFDGSPIDFKVFRKEEADEEGIDYKDWRYAEPGDWIITDDNWVGELLFKTPMKGGAAHNLTLSFAVQILPFRDGVPGTRKLLYEPYRLAGCGYDRMIPRPWDVRELRRPRTKQLINHWAHITLAKHGKTLSTVEWERIGRICFPTAPRPDLSAKRLFSSDLIRSVGHQRIDEILEEKGITMGSILDEYAEALRISKEKKDALNIIRVADKYSELVQKYRRVDEHFDETVYVEDDTPLERAPEPKRLSE